MNNTDHTNRIKEVIEIKGVRSDDLAGLYDFNIRQIRNTFDIDLSMRGDKLTLSGVPDDVRSAAEVVHACMNRLEKGQKITENYIKSMLAEGDSGKGFLNSLDIYPRTAGQAQYIDAMAEHDMVFVTGPAGTGKTYLAVAYGVASLKKNLVSKIVLVRPAVEAGEKLGFLPGDLEEKVNPYLMPIYDALYKMLGFKKVNTYMEQGVIEVVPIAFMRGRTLHRAFIIMDEGQNTSKSQMLMFLTRMGVDSKVVVTGDITQIDLPPGKPSGMLHALSALEGVPGIGFTELERSDIVRHDLVKEIVTHYNSGPGIHSEEQDNG